MALLEAGQRAVADSAGVRRTTPLSPQRWPFTGDRQLPERSSFLQRQSRWADEGVGQEISANGRSLEHVEIHDEDCANSLKKIPLELMDACTDGNIYRTGLLPKDRYSCSRRPGVSGHSHQPYVRRAPSGSAAPGARAPGKEHPDDSSQQENRRTLNISRPRIRTSG